MKHPLTRQLFLLLCCFGIGTVEAQSIPQTIRFATPAKYCFQQTLMRGDRDRLIIEHHLLVAEEDYFKTGNVFVAARFKSTGRILLTNGFYWRGPDEPGPLVSIGPFNGLDEPTSEALHPVIPISVFYNPTDVRPVGGDVELLVGYGLKAKGANTRVAFDEMLASKRYQVLWDSAGFGLSGTSYHICLETTALRKDLITLQVTTQ